VAKHLEQILKTYWAGNSTLTAALPAASLWFLTVPKSPAPAFPYAVVTPIGSPRPAYLVRSPNVEYQPYQISVFHTNLNALNVIVDAIRSQLDWAALDPQTTYNRFESENTIPEPEQLGTSPVYHKALTYTHGITL
jgi:hypothetical protein